MKIKIFANKVVKRLYGGVVTLYPSSPTKGRVLLSYKTEAIIEFGEKEHTHTNIWECREIAQIFLRLGYIVDVIDWYNHGFKPKHKYRYFIDIGSNLARISGLLNKDCVKIFHATTSHWLFNNTAEYSRLVDLQKRRGVALRPRRQVIPAQNIQEADFATLIGNKATEDTYAYARKKMHQIPISTTHVYDFPANKDFEKSKKNFIWLGGVGMVHKGLDLVLEAFARLPDHKLFICGEVSNEKDFEKLYWQELYRTDNIKMVGKVDVGGSVFRNIADSSVALVYPSCAEGQSGGVITCMHAGLIPAISYHSGVDVGDFGLLIKESTVDGIIKTVRDISVMSKSELEKRSRQTWEYARENHTRERFSEEFTKFVEMLESGKSFK